MGISIANQRTEEGTNLIRSLGRKRTSNVHEKVRDKAAEQIIFVTDAPDETIIPQHRKFLERREQEAKNKEEADQGSKDLIKLFLKKNESCAKK